MSEYLLRVNDLKKHFPVHGGVFYRKIATVYAVDGVTIEIKPGETVGLVGESGCGKSTLGRSLLQLYPPTAGEVWFQNRDLTKLNKRELRELRPHMQMIFQDPYESLNPRHSIGDLLEEPLLIHHRGTPEERKQRVLQLLDRVGLPKSAAGRYPHEFSGGQRQRIGIARAISLNPELIVCDEPVSALDVSIQSQVLNLLLDIQQEMNITYLFIAHDLAVVKHMSDRVAVMYLGKIVEFADAEQLYQTPMHPYTRALISAIPEPDPRHGRDHQVLEGEVPSPMQPPSGCAFHTRCPHARDVCREQMPELVVKPGMDSGHQVACHFAEELRAAL